MLRIRGFTLIEVMIVVVLIAVLAAIGFPSYRDHIARGQRSQGQQYLADVAQRQEQFLLDRRAYATDPKFIEEQLGMKPPSATGIKYKDPTVTATVGPPAGYVICMDPADGSNLAQRNDGTLCINSQGERWRQPTGGNTVFDSGSECLWENRSCTYMPQ